MQCNALLGGMEYGLRDVPGDRQGWYLQGAFALAGGLEAASVRLASLGRGAGTRALNLVDDVADAARALENLCPGGRCQAMCFTVGTPVVTSEGLLGIEMVEVGDRVPQYGGEQCSIEPFVDDLASCAVITLEFENPFGYEDSLVVELMRSTEWLEANQVAVGGTVRLAFEELKVDDDGYVRSISSCPVIAQGEGCVVTGTFTHLNSDVLELTFANSALVLQPTALHPLWSEDRNDWVRAGLLLVGEHLRSESGPLEIATIQWVDGTHQVFNLEVAGNHTYLVGADAVLSHNSCSLEEAAQAAKNALQHVDDFFVPKKHLPDAGGRWARFADGTDANALIKESMESADALFFSNNVDNSVRVASDFKRVIGTNGETKLRTIVGLDGKIWSAFPVK